MEMLVRVRWAGGIVLECAGENVETHWHFCGCVRVSCGLWMDLVLDLHSDSYLYDSMIPRTTRMNSPRRCRRSSSSSSGRPPAWSAYVRVWRWKFLSFRARDDSGDDDELPSPSVSESPAFQVPNGIPFVASSKQTSTLLTSPSLTNAFNVPPKQRTCTRCNCGQEDRSARRRTERLDASVRPWEGELVGWSVESGAGRPHENVWREGKRCRTGRSVAGGVGRESDRHERASFYCALDTLGAFISREWPPLRHPSS